MSDQQTFVKVIAVGVGAMGCAILALYVKMNKMDVKINVMDVKINVMDVKINALLDAVLGRTCGGDTWRPTLPPTGDHRTSVASVGDHGPRGMEQEPRHSDGSMAGEGETNIPPRGTGGRIEGSDTSDPPPPNPRT